MKAIILCIFILSVTTSCFAQYGNETITITTYYPSPHGVYGVLTLYPRTSEPENPREGDMFYNQSDKNIYFYKGSSAGGWQIVGGEASAGDGLVYNLHTKADCEALRGDVTDTDVSAKQCRFNLPSCPSGWTRYQSWSNTTAISLLPAQCINTCWWGRWYYNCDTGSHAWANMATETCQRRYGNQCFDNTDCNACGHPPGPECEAYSATATITQIGCY